MACKPGSVPCRAMPPNTSGGIARQGDDHSSGTSVAGRLARPTRAAARKRACLRTSVPPLFGLAPGGVCRAVSVAGDAVRSYRTLSPLPRPRRSAVCFLWHCPWGRPRRALPGTVFPWSPDFPPPPPESDESGHPAIWRRLRMMPQRRKSTPRLPGLLPRQYPSVKLRDRNQRIHPDGRSLRPAAQTHARRAHSARRGSLGQCGPRVLAALNRSPACGSGAPSGRP